MKDITYTDLEDGNYKIRKRKICTIERFLTYFPKMWLKKQIKEEIML